ncbi:alpha/beta fold hydrolase [Arthrobacter sp. AZCC_0090]|uniref:alpha/beta fold hydrolase n=1 Tax=Arthrobacter sp. AZCC_0090 TaxID=2735881 RepID=UPI001618651C|nr:alpha/beta hydrolase [Arthrobacter sp. AZCC_0090]MBB6406341.1 pimeloyl-ACP methyl ester carboxylesterase [Arthrobacter sp. AZCC_0090]
MTTAASTSASPVADPEIGLALRHGRFTTNYHDLGSGPVVLLLHGSGPGVSAWANWRLVMPRLAENHRVIAPDIVGFGYTEIDDDVVPTLPVWLEHITSFLSTLNVDRVLLVGNSFGGAISLWLASENPELVERIVLMGSVGSDFKITEGLEAVWGYEPSVEGMANLLDVFTHDTAKLPSTLAAARFEASNKPGAAKRWNSLFPAPRQRWIEALALGADRLGRLKQPTLLVHGREDQVIPLESSYQLLEHIDDAQLHVYPHCGHWVQIERASDFTELVADFFATTASAQS